MSATLHLPKVIKHGPGCIHELGEIAKDLHSTHVFVLTGSLFESGQLKATVEQEINAEGLDVTFSIHNKGEPNTEHLNRIVNEIRQCNADCVVAIGGGSVIDLAKAASALALESNITLDDLSRLKIIQRLPFIAIPTTAGTGSEATKVTVITDVESKVKKNPAHPSLIPDVAILDPQLTRTLPQHVTAYTGLDALAHAMEAFISTQATSLSDQFALKALRLIGESLPKVYLDSQNEKARGDMLLASCYAGIAFTNASTNLAHAVARPLGARFNIPHGLSVALLLPFVVEFGLEVANERYCDVAKALLGGKLDNEQYQGSMVVKQLFEFNSSFHIWKDGAKYLKQTELVEEQLPLLIKDALSGNGILTNPKIPTESDIEEIYRDLLLELEKYSTMVDSY